MTRPSLHGPSMRLRLWVVALCAALAVACGGGVGTGGTGDATSASGPITGFGSIFVAGIEFDDTDATVLDDTGAPVVRDGDELRLGMTVHVEGVLSDGQAAVATTIRITTAVVGSADALDTPGGSLAVLGQRVRVNAATVFDPALAGGLASLRPGDRVTVFGLPDPAGGHVATRIERAPAAAETRVKGEVSDLDPEARTFRVGSALISYAGSSPPAGLANGRVVGARLTATGPGSFNVVAFDPAEAPAPQDSRAEIEGVVAAIPANRRFIVDGVTVDAQRARFDPNPAALEVGARVEVEGRMSGGVLVAERVKVFAADEVETRPYKLNGAITDVDAGGRTFVVRRTTVDYGNAQFSGGTAADLAVGVRVRVEGPLSPDGARLRATRIEIR